MRRIDTWRVVAMVANFDSVRNCAKDHLPGNPVGKPCSAIVMKLAVATRHASTGPRPAPAEFADICLAPEPVLQRERGTAERPQFLPQFSLPPMASAQPAAGNRFSASIKQT